MRMRFFATAAKFGGSASVGQVAQLPDNGLRTRNRRVAAEAQGVKAITPHDIVFTVRADDHRGKRIERLAGGEFIRRFLLHVLPTGIKRIRHYGVLASACKTDKLAEARLALQMPSANRQAQASAQAFMARVAKIDALLCPCCKANVLKVVATLAGCARLPTPGSSVGQARGPP